VLFRSSNFIFFLIEPDSRAIATILGLTAFVLPWCLLYGIATSRKNK
jgi:hypothetical protein